MVSVSTSGEPLTTDRRLAVFYWLCAFILFGAFFLRLGVLWDTDSYYHLAVARLYAQHGPFARIPWARFSLIGNGADKDLLFHLLLAPFAALPDAAIGGRIALAMLNATLATIIAMMSMRVLGNAAFLLPPAIWIGAPPFFSRIVRLRPELLALMLLLLAIIAAARRRYALLALIAFAFTLGYTAFHVLAAIAILWFVWSWIREKKPDVALVAPPLLGIAAGLLLRPHPIANLRLWFVQNVVFFANMSRLDVGNEINPPLVPQTLFVSSIWIGGMGILMAMALRGGRRESREGGDIAAYTTIAAAVFILLFFRFGRMALYAFPLATLAIVLGFGARLRPRQSVVVLTLLTLIALPVTFDSEKRRFIASGSADVTELDWFAFGRSVPAGARIAARWADADAYVFWAPQGRYLNVLDPTFMFVTFPRQYEAQRKLFSGEDPDIPRTLVEVLDSDYLALDWTTAPEPLIRRLRNDPRLEVVYGGYNVLFRVRRR
ncbi:MAG TPA: hypothetical protein VLV78_00615 [Thermoanaerobaculia bacterium]|nr:hypothetical protein [Thermoanaerobaculia bacterium]